MKLLRALAIFAAGFVAGIGATYYVAWLIFTGFGH